MHPRFHAHHAPDGDGSGNGGGNQPPAGMPKWESELRNDNAKLREKNRVLRTELDAAKQKVPEGAVVLAGEEAKAWEALKALGKTPKEISEALAERDTLAGKLAEHEARERSAKVAGILKWDPDLTPDFLKDKGLTALELKEEEIDRGNGKTEKGLVPYVMRGEGKDAKQEKLADVVSREFPKYLTALTATGGASGGTAGASGVPFPEQRGNGTRQSGYDPVAEGKALAQSQKAAQRDASLAFK